MHIHFALIKRYVRFYEIEGPGRKIRKKLTSNEMCVFRDKIRYEA